MVVSSRERRIPVVVCVQGNEMRQDEDGSREKIRCTGTLSFL
jgi:hypothetical protein